MLAAVTLIVAFPPMVPPPKLSDSSGERPAGGNVGSIYIDYGIRTNCSTRQLFEISKTRCPAH